MTPLQSAPELPAVDPGSVVGAVVVLVGSYVAARLVAWLLARGAERVPSRRITITMVIPLVRLAIYGVALYVVLGPLLRLSATQLLAVSGLLGAAIGFGLKDLVASLVGGFVVALEKPYRVGDRIGIADHYGEVTGIGLRATTVTTPDDDAVVVPNDVVFKDAVANANDGDHAMMAVVEVAVAHDADVDRAVDVLRQAIATSRYVYVDDDHPVAVRVEDDGSHRTLRGKAYVADHRDEQAFRSDVARRTLRIYGEEDLPQPRYPAPDAT